MDLQTGEKRALKYCSIDELKEIQDEIAMQSMNQHPNIVRLYEAFLTDTQICMAMELMTGGMLTECCLTTEPMPERFIAYVAKSALQGFAFMHRNWRIHRDIKSDNILV